MDISVNRLPEARSNNIISKGLYIERDDEDNALTNSLLNRPPSFLQNALFADDFETHEYGYSQANPVLQAPDDNSDEEFRTRGEYGIWRTPAMARKTDSDPFMHPDVSPVHITSGSPLGIRKSTYHGWNHTDRERDERAGRHW